MRIIRAEPVVPEMSKDEAWRQVTRFPRLSEDLHIKMAFLLHRAAPDGTAHLAPGATDADVIEAAKRMYRKQELAHRIVYGKYADEKAKALWGDM